MRTAREAEIQEAVLALPEPYRTVVLLRYHEELSHEEIRQTGFHPEKLYQFSDLDHVNMFNGNLIITLPMGETYPLGGGSSSDNILVHNSFITGNGGAAGTQNAGIRFAATFHGTSDANMG